MAEITRSANALHALGVSADHSVAYVLPNLPETHFTIWGGEAAGVVLAVNPLLEPDLIIEILRAAKVRVLVTLAPFPGAELWSKLAPHLSVLSELRVVALVAMPYLGSVEETAVAAAAVSVPDAKFRDRGFPRGDAGPAGRSPGRAAVDHGALRIVLLLHRWHDKNRGAHARQRDFRCLGCGASTREREEPRTYFCGLPLFHVNAQLATGLLPWMHGDHVLFAAPEGYRGKNLIARFWEIAAHYRIATFSGVPTIYAACWRRRSATTTSPALNTQSAALRQCRPS
ncbi:AMP-binding protein [Bradyrhizobium erythrophlei]|uniref:AMP-binding protein n=1 Tax=Bradyrhizobium erythrophlei TaxID=1437360 RepID=UPI0023EA640E|nr:AMP-binding protein [Bradyrhizobium erythrophlei]